jgi:hypothetical protein
MGPAGSGVGRAGHHFPFNAPVAFDVRLHILCRHRAARSASGPVGTREGRGFFGKTDTALATGLPLRFLAREIQGGVKLTFESTRRVVVKLLM